MVLEQCSQSVVVPTHSIPLPALLLASGSFFYSEFDSFPGILSRKNEIRPRKGEWQNSAFDTVRPPFPSFPSVQPSGIGRPYRAQNVNGESDPRASLGCALG